MPATHALRCTRHFVRAVPAQFTNTTREFVTLTHRSLEEASTKNPMERQPSTFGLKRQKSRSIYPTMETEDEEESLHKSVHPMTRQNSRHEIVKGDDITFGQRMLSTVEVMVSKIFPAGFGWQGASIVAGDYMGLDDSSAGFALATGVGDFTGVFVGHTGYYMLKKIFYDESISMEHEAQTGLLLASAAFCSGTVWQPVVNFCHMTNMGFNASVALTTAVCGGAFFGGLRAGRVLYAPRFEGIEEGNFDNLKNDAALSLSIGAATGCFVGTDISYSDNWLRPIVGIEEGISVPTGMCVAGTSTALGFLSLQSVQNVIVPKGKNWID